MYVLVNTSDVYICYVQLKAGEVSEVIRVFLQTPTGCCHVDITRAVLQSHLKVALLEKPTLQKAASHCWIRYTVQHVTCS